MLVRQENLPTNMEENKNSDEHSTRWAANSLCVRWKNRLEIVSNELFANSVLIIRTWVCKMVREQCIRSFRNKNLSACPSHRIVLNKLKVTQSCLIVWLLWTKVGSFIWSWNEMTRAQYWLLCASRPKRGKNEQVQRQNDD